MTAGINERGVSGQEGFGIGGIQDWRDTGKEGLRTGRIQERRDSGLEGFRIGGIQDWRDTGKEGFGT